LQIAAGIATPKVYKRGARKGEAVMAADEEGKPIFDKAGKPVPVMNGKYSGLHALRHFFCSWCAEKPEKGDGPRDAGNDRRPIRPPVQI
jgi:hypothetical protein